MRTFRWRSRWRSRGALAVLDEALEIQLCGRYLRSDRGRYGVLLLVHQKARPVGWEDKVLGTYLTFAGVVARLRTRAMAISGEGHDAPQPEVAVLDPRSSRLKLLCVAQRVAIVRGGQQSGVYSGSPGR